MATKLAICASGEGSNFESLVIASRAGLLQAEVVGLICNNPKAQALERAERLKIPAKIIERTDDRAMLSQLIEWQAEWVALAGFLSKVGPSVLERYQGKIVNVHPALLPKYGGKGMFGLKIHEAVLKAGERVTGVTIHMVESEYDQGHILAQKQVPVEANDTAQRLADRVKQKERAFYPVVLNDLVLGRIKNH